MPQTALSRFDFIDHELPRLGAIATAGYFLGLRIRGASPLMAFHTYPQAWIDEYTGNGYMLRDPVTTWAMTVGGTVRWNSPLLPDPFGIFRRAKTHGLNHGASIAHGAIGSLTICSAARSDRAFTNDEIAAMRQIVLGLHERVALPPSLSPDQKTLLSALAQGRAPAQLSSGLGVSKAAAERAVKSLCEELSSRTPDEAIRRARDYKLI